MIKEIMAAVSIPVMAKARIGHIVEYGIVTIAYSAPSEGKFWQSSNLGGNRC